MDLLRANLLIVRILLCLLLVDSARTRVHAGSMSLSLVHLHSWLLLRVPWRSSHLLLLLLRVARGSPHHLLLLLLLRVAWGRSHLLPIHLRLLLHRLHLAISTHDHLWLCASIVLGCRASILLGCWLAIHLLLAWLGV